MKPVPVNSGRVPALAREILLTPSGPGQIPLPTERFAADGMSISRWTLTEDERVRVLAGEDIILGVLCPDGPGRHPPVVLTVGTIPVPDRSPVPDVEDA